MYAETQFDLYRRFDQYMTVTNKHFGRIYCAHIVMHGAVQTDELEL